VSNQTRSVFEAALALPEKERAALAQLLLDSLPGGRPDARAGEPPAGGERRHAALEPGPADEVTWDDLRDDE
jgi:hypothetical protein